MAQQTLRNSTVQAAEDVQLGGNLRVLGGKFTIVDPTDTTKILAFDCSGITTGTTTTFSPSGGTEVTLDGTQSLTNKGLEDTTTTIFNHTDPTKLVKFSASGITTATTRTITIPDSNGTLAYLAGSTFTTAILTAPTINAATLTGAISGGTVAPTVLTVPASTALTTPAITGGSIVRTGQEILITGFARAGTGVGFVANVGLTNNVGNMATLPAAQTAATLVIPISGLPVGATITSYHLQGNIISAGTTATLDADLRSETIAAAGPTDASLGTMTQISVTSNTAANSSKSITSHMIVATESYYMLLTATTGATCSMTLQGLGIIITTA